MIPLFSFLLVQASTAASGMDWLLFAIILNAVVFTVGVFIAMLVLVVKYRRGKKVDRSHPVTHNVPLEVTWTVIPLAIALGFFVWSSMLYFAQAHIPAGAMEIHVVGKQWMWKLQQPNGRWEMNELHVPAGRPVKLVMTSEDVIHAFYVPEFRLKQDVIPGQYTRMWFNAKDPGVYKLYCAEFCGTLHSGMIGTVTVMAPTDYEAWLQKGQAADTVAARGQTLFIRHGCNGCHGANSSVKAPRLEGIYNKPIPVQLPPAGVTGQALINALPKIPATTVIADDTYLHDSIVLPEKAIAGGFVPIMPSFKNRLTEQEIFDLTAYIKSLGNTVVLEDEGITRPKRLSEEDYKARTGFVPENIKSLTDGTRQPPGPTARGTQRP